MNWNALPTGALPRPLAFVGMVLGVACIVLFAVRGLAPVTLILGSIWSLWLGLVSR